MASVLDGLSLREERRRAGVDVGRPRMSEWRLELLPSDPAIGTRLMEALSAHGVAYSVEPPHTMVVEGEHAGDVEDLLGEEIYDAVIGAYFMLTCDDGESEEETRQYMQSHAIPFVEHRFDGDLAFVINRRHDPDDWM